MITFRDVVCRVNNRCLAHYKEHTHIHHLQILIFEACTIKHMYAKRTFCYIIRKTSDTHVRVFARSQDHILPCLHAPMITCAHNSHTLHTCFDAIQRIHYRTITRANTQRSIATHCTYIHIQTMHAHIHTRTHTHTGTLEDPYL